VLVSDIEDVVTDLHGLDATARAEQPGLPVVLLGHSMGGLIGARYAQRYADTLAAVVLTGPLLDLGHPALGMLDLDDIPDIALDISTLSRDPAVGQAYATDPLVWHWPFKRTTLAAFARAMQAVADGPTLGDLPLLSVHGENDQLVPVEGSRPVIARLRGSRSQGAHLPGCPARGLQRDQCRRGAHRRVRVHHRGAGDGRPGARLTCEVSRTRSLRTQTSDSSTAWPSSR